MGASRLIPSSGSTTDLIRAPNEATIAQRVGTTSKQNLFTDALGSTFATADDNATTLAKRYTYDPDGNGTGTTPSVLYAGGIRIGGLYHDRYYEPTTASWTQQDLLNQIGSLAQSNRHTYAGGDPVDATDPTGSVSASPETVCASTAYRKAHPGACESGFSAKEILMGCLKDVGLGFLIDVTSNWSWKTVAREVAEEAPKKGRHRAGMLGGSMDIRA